MTVGAAEANAITVAALVRPGDEVIVMEPGYRQAGCPHVHHGPFEQFLTLWVMQQSLSCHPGVPVTGARLRHECRGEGISLPAGPRSRLAA